MFIQCGSLRVQELIAVFWHSQPQFKHSGHRRRDGGGAGTGERRSRGGSWISQTWTQRFLRLNKRQRISLHSGSDAKTFSEPRMASSLGLQWLLCHLLASPKSIHTAGAMRERDFYRWPLQVLKVSALDLIGTVLVFSLCILICISLIVWS